MVVAQVPWPAGMTRITVTGSLSFSGRPKQGTVQVFAERKFGYIGTDWIMDELSDPIPLKAGRFALEIPHSNQFGLIGDNGASVTNIGYKIVFTPLQSAKGEVLAWTLLPVSLGTTVAFSKLGNLGGWPNAFVAAPPILPPPPTPGGGSLIETPPGSGIFVLQGA